MSRPRNAEAPPLCGRLRWGWIVACLALGTLSACDESYDDLSIELVSTPPEQASVEIAYPRIRLPAGVALAVEFQPQGGGQRDFSPDTQFSVYSNSPEIARAWRMTDNRRFLIVGRQPGEAIFGIQLGEQSFGPLRVEVSQPRSDPHED